MTIKDMMTICIIDGSPDSISSTPLQVLIATHITFNCTVNTIIILNMVTGFDYKDQSIDRYRGYGRAILNN